MAPRAGVLVCVYALCTQHTAVRAAPVAEPQSSHTHPCKEVCISLGNGWGRVWPNRWLAGYRCA